MPQSRSIIGQRSEAVFENRILEDGIIGAAHFMGEKAEAVDFLCEFDDGGKRYSFKVQVKGTLKGYLKKNGNLRVQVNKKTIQILNSDLLPTYIAGVDLTSEKVYLYNTSHLTNRLSALPTSHCLSLNNQGQQNIVELNILRNDVITFWQHVFANNLKSTFNSSIK